MRDAIHGDYVVRIDRDGDEFVGRGCFLRFDAPRYLCLLTSLLHENHRQFGSAGNGAGLLQQITGPLLREQEHRYLAIASHPVGDGRAERIDDAFTYCNDRLQMRVLVGRDSRAGRVDRLPRVLREQQVFRTQISGNCGKGPFTPGQRGRVTFRGEMEIESKRVKLVELLIADQRMAVFSVCRG